MRTDPAHTEPKELQHHVDQQAVRDLLNDLARAITAGDGRAAARLWEAPAFVLGADMAMPIANTDEVAKFFGGAKQQYNERGITDTRPQIIDEEWLGDRICVVKVRWPYLDAEGKEVGAERSDYTLRKDDAGRLKVRSVLMRGVEPSTRGERAFGASPNVH